MATNMIIGLQSFLEFNNIDHIFFDALNPIEKYYGDKKDKLWNNLVSQENWYKHPEYESMMDFTSKNFEMMKIPFNILGIMNEYHLVRFSGITGAYTQYKPKIENSHDKIEIESSEILVDLGKQKQKYDTVEIFVN